MEWMTRLARLITVLRPRPRLPPVTIATFAFDDAVFSFVIVRSFSSLLHPNHTFGSVKCECQNPPSSCLFLHRELDSNRSPSRKEGRFVERAVQSDAEVSPAAPAKGESGLFSIESVLNLQKLIFAGSPLSEILTNIAQLVESQAEGMSCTIWLPDE